MDVILDVAYGELISGLNNEQKKDIDQQLAGLELEAASEERTVTKELSDGRVVQISEARLARIQANVAGMAQMKKGT